MGGEFRHAGPSETLLAELRISKTAADRIADPDGKLSSQGFLDRKVVPLVELQDPHGPWARHECIKVLWRRLARRSVLVRRCKLGAIAAHRTQVVPGLWPNFPHPRAKLETKEKGMTRSDRSPSFCPFGDILSFRCAQTLS